MGGQPREGLANFFNLGINPGMMRQPIVTFSLLCVGLLLLPINARADEIDALDSTLAEITVHERRVANEHPAGTFATPVTVLRFDPTIELQSRGLAEGQADVTVRGGLFENTGFKVGAVTLTDPQTGHYVAELPIDPALLSTPEIRTGIDNALHGFNSNVATISYSLPKLHTNGSAMLGVGSDSLSFQSLRYAKVAPRGDDASLGLQMSAALSEGDGSVPDGDHDFKRYNVQMQYADDNGQGDLIVAYQDKFYGWPGAYTGFATLPETDHTKTTLVLGNYRRAAERGWWQASAYYRGLEDDYDFNRTTQESGTPGSFDHETRVYGAGLQGQLERDSWTWNYALQLTSDELLESTDLTEGDFTSRSYATLRIVPSIDLVKNNDSVVTLSAGVVLDSSNRDEDEMLPVLGLSHRHETNRGSRLISLEYAGTSQVPGYTVLNSRPTGLFGGNPDLGRERADEVTMSMAWEATSWQTEITGFYRRDDDIVDWTFASGAPFARQANAVDVDVAGAMISFTRSWSSLDLVAAYTYLDKDADYGEATVDASFYALNFARHRATLALRYDIAASLQLRLDNEYRQQEENALRGSSDNALLVSAALAWKSNRRRGLGAVLAVDNLGDDDYQQFPGTPAAGRQLSLSMRYDW